jgi:hypothetical protein
MILPNSHRHGSVQIGASNDLDECLASSQPSLSSLDLVESQQGEFPSVNDLDLRWFTDFIFYESDDPEPIADVTRGLNTSGSGTEDLISGMTETPVLTLSSAPILGMSDARAADNSGFDTWHDPTGLEDSDLAVGFLPNSTNSGRIVTEQAPYLYAPSHSGDVSIADSEPYSPDHSIPAQIDAAPKLAVPRLRYFSCPTCNNHFRSDHRLRFVPDHAALFIC